MRRPAALVALLAAASCGDPLAPLPSEGAPRELAYTSYGFVAFTSDVRLAGDTVVLTRTESVQGGVRTAVARRVPSADEWRAFWREVRSAGVRTWPRACRGGDPGLQDGGGFRFALAWADARRAGEYGSAYPLAGGRCSDDAYGAAARFEQAVLTVAGLAPSGALVP